MPHEIHVAPGAVRQIREALGWWERNRPAAPGLLRAEIDRWFALIASQPGIGSPALDDSIRGVRRVHLGRVRYHLYYRVREEAVEILALWHVRRGQEATISKYSESAAQLPREEGQSGVRTIAVERLAEASRQR